MVPGAGAQRTCTTLRMLMRKRKSDSLNRSTMSEQVSWKRCLVSNRLNTEVFISAKLFEIRSVNSACNANHGPCQSRMHES